MVFQRRPHLDTFVVVTFSLWTRILLGYLSVVSVQIGVWALVAPRAFYDDFPGLGRAWVSVDGPFNEHLIRDVGALNLALAALFIAAFVRLGRELITMSGVLALVWGIPHTIYHLVNTEGLGSADLAVSLLGLVFFALAGGGLIYVAPRVASERAVVS